MIKMETTEPTVELKLKKGGAVKKMARGGAPMGAMVGAPKGGVMTGAAPAMPALAARRRAMKAMGAAPAAPVGPAAAMMGMKKGGEADIAQDKAMLKKAFMQHDMQEHKGGKGTKLKLKSGGMADKMEKFETKTTVEGNEGEFKKTKMHEAKPDRVKGPTGMIKEKNAGGYKTGGVVKGAGGFKTGGVVEGQGGFRKGGAIKKFAEGGRVQHDGGPEQMEQGKKKPAGPVSINSLAGTYKKGGAVMMAAGGDPNADFYRRKTEENEADAKAMRDALMFIPRKIHKAGKVVVDAMNPNRGAVTDTEREVSRTVVPAKKKGGVVC